MRVSKLFLKVFLGICILGKALATSDVQVTSDIVLGNESSGETKAVAAWTVLTYIAADNNLAPFASYNINDMSAGLTQSNGVNVLVQWDKPSDNKTWRYKITPGSKVDVGSLPSEMGYNPATELVSAMQWAIKNYPAQKYALILWDHGSGIEDFYPGVRSVMSSSKWLNFLPALPGRGILYDDSQGTCLTNQGLTSVLTQVKKMLGRNLDLIAMDACLMAMVEVTYQMKDLVNTFVASQQTIPGYGYPYSQFIKPLSLNPAGTSVLQLAQNIVSSYKNFYTTQMPTSDFTLSAIDATSINLIKQNIDQFIAAVNACSKVDAAKTKNIIIAARKASISFEMSEYIDLYSFYANVLNQSKKTSPKSLLILEKQNKKVSVTPTKAYQDALNVLGIIIQDGLAKIGKVVLQKTTGPVYSGAKGISIYYPADGNIHDSYPQTVFAQSTSWMKFVQVYH